MGNSVILELDALGADADDPRGVGREHLEAHALPHEHRAGDRHLPREAREQVADAVDAVDLLELDVERLLDGVQAGLPVDEAIRIRTGERGPEAV